VGKQRLRWNYFYCAWCESERQKGKRRNFLLRCPRCRNEALIYDRFQWCTTCKESPQWQRHRISSLGHMAVSKAVRKGLLPRLDGSIACVDCGVPAAVYDHREYAKPLEVDPVCKSCNVRRGPAKETAPLIASYARRRRRA
jgi:hypothetical protein